MSHQKWCIAATSLVLMGGTAFLIGRLQANQELGRPALRVVSEPIFDPDGKQVGTNSVYLPEVVLDFSSEALPVTPLELGWLPPDTTYGRRLYKGADGFEVAVSAVLMGSDRTSIHKPEYCLTGVGWRIENSDLATVSIHRPHDYDLPVMMLTTIGTRKTSGGEVFQAKGLYVYWFVAENELTARHGQRMWWMARDLMLTGTLQRWAYVSCMAVYLPGQEEATFERVKQFIAAAVPEFQTTTGAATSRRVAGAETPPRP